MILHLAPDEKFIPFLQGLFEEANPKGNMWRILTDKPQPAMAFKNGDTLPIKSTYLYSEGFKKDTEAANCVIIHSLMLSGFQKIAVLRRIPKQMPLVWRGWGYDYYEYLIVANRLQLIQPETAALVENIELAEKNFLYRTLQDSGLPQLKSNYHRLVNKWFMQRVNYFSCCVPEDFYALKQAIPNFPAQFLPLNYYSKEDIFLRGCDLPDMSGKDILLGNSATPTNNHIEALRILSILGINDRKIIVPLGYGDEKYKKEIIRIGEKLLGKNFIPLTQYMPIQEYNQLVSCCGNLMMNHVRQQGMGNISAALLRGGKVFLRTDNPIYRYYTRLGVKIFPIDDGIALSDFDTALDKDDIDNNKHIMSGLWARETGLKQVSAVSSLGILE